MDRGAKDTGGAAPRRDARWVTAALICALVSAFLAPASSSWRHPPRVEPEWVTGGLMATAALAVALVGSARTSRRLRVRAALAAAAVLALFALHCPITSYYLAFGDLPWLVVVPLGVAVVVASWLVHQRWLSVLLVAAALLMVVGVRLPPSRQLFPREVRNGGLEVALGGLVRDQGMVFCTLSLAVQGKASLGSYDLGSARVTGSCAWGILPVVAWHPHSLPFDADTSGRRSLMAMEVFPPRWVRSFDLRLSVPRWPAKPAASFKLAVLDETATTTRTGQNGLPFTVPEVRWTTSRHESPPKRCLKVVIAVPDSPSAGRQEPRSRFTDEKGRVLRAYMGSAALTGGRWKEEWEVFPQGRPHAITLDVFTGDQMDAARVVFKFSRLPNPNDRGPGR